MPKSKQRKKRNKKYTPREPKVRKMTAEEQIKAMYGDKKPYCKVCGTECVLAPEEDVIAYKQYDSTYPFDFIFVPTCGCWEKNEDWMSDEI